jgi:hemolysin activation/secretion protein
MGLIYQNANVWNRDHALLIQFMSSPGNWEQVRIIGVGYKVPLYTLGDTFEFNVSDSNVDSRGTVSGTDIAAVGKGKILGLRYIHNLDASAEWQNKFTAGLESHLYGNAGNAGESHLSTLPLALGYTGNWRAVQRELSWSANWLRNIPTGPYGLEPDLNADGGRAGAQAAYQAWKVNAQFTERFANQWTLRVGVSGQFTQDLLIAAEQFGIGGADSVRGFGEREAAGDQGVRAGMELTFTPWELGALRLVPLMFVDAASVRRNAPLAGEIGTQTLSSVGLGLRAASGRHASLRADWGYVTQGLVGPADSAPNGATRGDSRLHMSLVWIF